MYFDVQDKIKVNQLYGSSYLERDMTMHVLAECMIYIFKNKKLDVRFEIFMAVTMKNGVI
jgi:hypothetical protein